MSKVIIYVDGGCRGNNKKVNVGGWGAVLEFNGNVKELKGQARNTTNNRMEITAAIEALKAMKSKKYPIIVNTDSAYVCNCINNRWYVKWMQNGWRTSSNKTVENRELWAELIELVESFPFISFVKVKGHSGVPGNERADQLANEAMDEVDLG